MAGPVTVGIDLGGTKCLGVALSSDGKILAEHRLATPLGEEAVLDALAAVANELRQRVQGVAAVGVGAPGLVDRAGVLRYAPNLSGVRDFDVRGSLIQRLDLPVQVENDATSAAWGERQVGAARGLDDVVLVTLGTGIGGGFVAGGVLQRGAHGFAGEVGHMVVDPDGPDCPCGQRGCWERFASGAGLGRLGRDAAVAGRARHVVDLAGGDPEAVRGEHVTAAALDGDAEAITVVDRFAWWVALGLSNLANIFDPEAFVVGGGLVEMGDLLFVPLRAAFDGLVLGARYRPQVQIVQAALGEHAGAVGAGLLAREVV
jgi:glucokinase